MSSITAAITSLKAASEIAQAMVGVRDAAMLQAKTIELQSAILAAQSSAITAQSEQFTLLERIRNLEEEIARVEAWNTEKRRYILKELDRGRFTYVLKEEEGATEPIHQICANCYDTHNKKSILQKETRAIGRTTVLVCNSCNAEIIVSGLRQQDHKRGK